VLLLAAVGLIALLLVGPRLVDAYVNWLWFGEVGFRSVWVTVLLTRVAIFVAVALVGGRHRFSRPDAGLSLAAGLCTRRAAHPLVGMPGDAQQTARFGPALNATLRGMHFMVEWTPGVNGSTVPQQGPPQWDGDALVVEGTFSHSVTDDDAPSCWFAGFSSKWRMGFSHLRGGS
jgi:Uncharacterised protein family (UPF0182)